MSDSRTAQLLAGGTVTGDLTINGSLTVDTDLNVTGDFNFNSVSAQTLFLGDDDPLAFGNTSASPDFTIQSDGTGLDIRGNTTITIEDSTLLDHFVFDLSNNLLQLDKTASAAGANSQTLRLTAQSSVGDRNMDILNDAEVGSDEYAIKFLNNGGTTVFSLDETGNLQVGTAGSAGTPSVARTGDPDTGIYWDADNSVAISTGGTKRFDISTGNATFADRIRVGADGAVGDLSIRFRDANIGFWNNGPDRS